MGKYVTAAITGKGKTWGISEYLCADKIQRRLKVTPYVCSQSCRAGSRLRGSKINPRMIGGILWV
eukprot:12460720-Ditylum_brightwellii.AAC.1